MYISSSSFSYRLLSGLLFCLLIACRNEADSNNQYVNKWIGTGLEAVCACFQPPIIGRVAQEFLYRTRESVGMAGIFPGADHDDPSILGFSHLHKSGGGCADFLDILFMPLPLNSGMADEELYSKQYQAVLSHKDEKAEPGYYSVGLYDKQLTVELTASRRCGLQRYTYASEGEIPVIVDIKRTL